ncbi:hypothetical protein [Sphingomonas sp. SCN 67-18]|mgnify:CR=1 FL=1|uniref:hypothetical protein n=1 Tax=uncultured Sphingomonas sp. TaxID=158754 RepID=UPI0025D4F7C4|nr:hypothetical protein [Sphingomonas sp. SCN 67-18]
MTITALAVLLLTATGAADGAEEPLPLGVIYAQLHIRQRVIVRVPTRPDESRPAPPPTQKWKERKGPECIPARELAGAAVNDTDSVDLLLRGGKRIRAQLAQDCPALNFYSGFYLRPGPDGQICEDRDSLHARSGGRCQIDRFRSLVPSRGK